MNDNAVDSVVLLRHGQTQWSEALRHTGRTDVELTGVGREQAAALVDQLPIRRFDIVLTSPLRRAADTAALAGFPDANTDPDLMEWDYGSVEGRTTAEMRKTDPGWDVWRNGVEGGETVSEVGERADRVINRCRNTDGNSLLVAHAHLLRILAARWLGLPADHGRLFDLDPAHWSVLSRQRETPIIKIWNHGR